MYQKPRSDNYTACAECSCTIYIRSQNFRSHHAKSYPAALAAHSLYNLCLLMHYVHSGRPVYLADIVEPASTRSTRRLRSTESCLYEIPRLRTKFGKRAFSFSGPSTWTLSPPIFVTKPRLQLLERNWKHFLYCVRLCLTTIIILRVFLYTTV